MSINHPLLILVPILPTVPVHPAILFMTHWCLFWSNPCTNPTEFLMKPLMVLSIPHLLQCRLQSSIWCSLHPRNTSAYPFSLLCPCSLSKLGLLSFSPLLFSHVWRCKRATVWWECCRRKSCLSLHCRAHSAHNFDGVQKGGPQLDVGKKDHQS